MSYKIIDNITGTTTTTDYDPMKDARLTPGDEINITGDGYDVHAHLTVCGDWLVYGTIGDADIDNSWTGVELATFADADEMIHQIICDKLA